jgi:uncharacterized protein involved in oxidation of intracellular sulfur
MNILLILNDAPYGNERTYNGVRLGSTLAKQDDCEVRIFLIGDAAMAAHKNQKVPKGFYNLEVMLENAGRHHAQIRVCGTCTDTRGINSDDLMAAAHRSTLDELAQWTTLADKVLTF